MLQLTRTTIFTDTRLEPDAIAFCPETGANFSESRGQYILVIWEPQYIVRHWSKRNVHTLEDALQRAQKSLDKIVAKQTQEAQ